MLNDVKHVCFEVLHRLVLMLQQRQETCDTARQRSLSTWQFNVFAWKVEIATYSTDPESPLEGEIISNGYNFRGKMRQRGRERGYKSRLYLSSNQDSVELERF